MDKQINIYIYKRINPKKKNTVNINNQIHKRKKEIRIQKKKRYKKKIHIQ